MSKDFKKVEETKVEEAPKAKKASVEEIKKTYVFKSDTNHNTDKYKRGDICDESNPDFVYFKQERIIITYDEHVIAESKRKNSSSLSRKAAAAAQANAAAKEA